ncbi:low temperature requirement protein A [Arthrobacter sp. zg-Y820]|uniref:low temperature requirement protein A n=1 Tax=unclassified Arthrobacter TaxID=235627 RepID=UPI001E5D17D9|nr:MULTISPECIES: low temperature requirement protein A [unclassified Arthrobacter]MCC9196918.1 low temperature requirement protein A [Arthrobacter sp. zg-Y820]MDK1279782.1 low temperature requirement protein A [Arthrobacter sp. zg.Y820]WIB10965.1 low temperature requirement protein A [Arthrobacter sp. zg-Y820]
MPHLPRPPRSAARISDETHRVTTFELFFDLVFVFAFTQVTGFMVHEYSFLGVLQGIVILVLLWWSWAPFSWLANQAHADEGLMRFGLSAVMVAIFIAALAIPEAFDDLDGGLDGPLVLALAYTAVRILHLGLYVYAAGNDQPLRRQIAKLTVTAVLGAALVITGALLGGPAQTWFWLAGMVLDTGLTFLISWHGNWRVQSAAHWTERYGLVVILALGESIVSIGAGASEVPVSVPVLTGAAAGICLSIGLWWLYFDVTAIAAEHRFAALHGAARSSAAVVAYTFLHLPLVAGIVLTALGVEDALAHVEEGKSLGRVGAFALFGGPALYLLAIAAFWRRMGAGWKKWRLGTAALLLALLAARPQLTSLAALLLVTVIIAALVAVENVRYAGPRGRIRGRSLEP